MENLALNCIIEQLIKVIETKQTIPGKNIAFESQQLNDILESDYNNYSKIDRLKFLIQDNKLINIELFNKYVAHDDVDKLELAEFYNKNFANTIPDIKPEPFYFKHHYNAELNTEYISPVVLITGFSDNKDILIECEGGAIDTGTPISITDNTSFSGIFESSKIVKSNGDGHIIIKVKGKSSTNYGVSKFIKISINGVHGIFHILTKADESEIIKPLKFKFNDIVNAEFNKEYTSNTIKVSEFKPEEEINITSEFGTIDAGTDRLSGTFSNSKTIKANITGSMIIAARTVSANNYDSYSVVVVNINKYNKIFSILTIPDPNPPPPDDPDDPDDPGNPNPNPPNPHNYEFSFKDSQPKTRGFIESNIIMVKNLKPNSYIKIVESKGYPDNNNHFTFYFRDGKDNETLFSKSWESAKQRTADIGHTFYRPNEAPPIVFSGIYKSSITSNDGTLYIQLGTNVDQYANHAVNVDTLNIRIANDSYNAPITEKLIPSTHRWTIAYPQDPNTNPDDDIDFCEKWISAQSFTIRGFSYGKCSSEYACKNVTLPRKFDTDPDNHPEGSDFKCMPGCPNTKDGIIYPFGEGPGMSYGMFCPYELDAEKCPCFEPR